MTTPLEPLRGPRVEPAAPARRVERSTRQQERGRQAPYEEPRRGRDDDEEAGEDTGLHVDVLA